jgi:hypothetical protein
MNIRYPYSSDKHQKYILSTLYTLHARDVPVPDIRPDNPVFLISVIRPDNGPKFDLPDTVLKMVGYLDGYPANWKIK